MNIILRTIKLILWLFVAAIAVLVILTSLNIFGLQMFVVRSGSMEPSIMTGSVVISIKDKYYNVGDVITFKTSANDDMVTHRIVNVNGSNDETTYMVKGDANETSDPLPILNSNVVGKVLLAVPFAGYLIAFIKSLTGLLLLIIIPSILLIINEIKRLNTKGTDNVRYRIEIYDTPNRSNSIDIMPKNIVHKNITDSNMSEKLI